MPKNSYVFPPHFRWGAATASYQIEGATTADGRKPSVWDVFSRTPGRIRTGETGDVACDHYHRYEDDVKMMAEMGLKHYRFSIAWPRIMPDGRGAVNEKGVDFYKRLLSCLHKYGITPHVTLFHWDLPQALQDRYLGWQSREIIEDFATYTTEVVKRLGDGIADWFTMNEVPCFVSVAHPVGEPKRDMHAPGVSVANRKAQHNIYLNAMLAHGRSVQAIRAASPQHCRISMADNPASPVPVDESPANIAAARRAFQNMWANGIVTWPALTGNFSPAFIAECQRDNSMPDVKSGDLELIHQPLDGYGLNIYSGSYVRAADNAQGFTILDLPEGYPRLDMPWLNLVPEAIYWTGRMIAEDCGFKGELVISENGCAAKDSINAQGEVMDLDRIVYLRSYLRQVHRLVDEGFNLTGYLQWSLMDNYEWAWGYSKRFGLVYTNFETQQRILKQSAHYYKECIRQNRVV